ncbi:MAG: hypothetical protein LBM77_04060 [Spirochaetaceae bacterium]|jgi:hypothetical protein|nr:hypothetical protein [Spirochaetaceae bacterium]
MMRNSHERHEQHKQYLLWVLCILCGLFFTACATTDANTAGVPAVESDTATSEEPQTSPFLKGLRRGEIIFFGSLPFAQIISGLSVDLYRMGTHDWDSAYAPIVGSVSHTTKENMASIGIGAGISLVVAVVDFFIHDAKTKKANSE